MEWNVSVKDYMGRVGDGVFTLLTIVVDNVVHNVTYWYNSEKQIITIPDELKDILNVEDIEEHSHYEQLLLKLQKMTVPYEQIINSIDDFDIEKYITIEEESEMGEDIDESEISYEAEPTKNNEDEC